MESLLAVLGVIALVLLVLWLSHAEITGALILKYTLEPFTRWFMRVFFGVDKPLVGSEALVGVKAVAISTFEPGEAAGSFQGRVEVRSESWSARSSEPIPQGSPVRVVSCQGVFLNVERSGV